MDITSALCSKGVIIASAGSLVPVLILCIERSAVAEDYT